MLDIFSVSFQYEKLRELESKTALPLPAMDVKTGRKTPYSRNSNSSMSIHLDVSL